MTEQKQRLEKAAEDERCRHALTRRSHEATSATVLAKISEQGQQLHSLEETVRSKESECDKLRLRAESAEGLVETFRAKLSELGEMVEASAESERCCKEALEIVREDQARIRSLLAMCQRGQRHAAPYQELEQRLLAARAEVGEARMHGWQMRRKWWDGIAR